MAAKIDLSIRREPNTDFVIVKNKHKYVIGLYGIEVSIEAYQKTLDSQNRVAHFFGTTNSEGFFNTVNVV